MLFQISIVAGLTKRQEELVNRASTVASNALNGVILAARNEETAGLDLVSRVGQVLKAKEDEMADWADYFGLEGRFYAGGFRWSLVPFVDYTNEMDEHYEALFEADIQEGFQQLEQIQGGHLANEEGEVIHH